MVSVNYWWQSWQLSDLELPPQLPVLAGLRRNPSRRKSSRRRNCCCSSWWASLSSSPPLSCLAAGACLASRHKRLILWSQQVQPSLWSVITLYLKYFDMKECCLLCSCQNKRHISISSCNLLLLIAFTRTKTKTASPVYMTLKINRWSYGDLDDMTGLLLSTFSIRPLVWFAF